MLFDHRRSAGRVTRYHPVRLQNTRSRQDEQSGLGLSLSLHTHSDQRVTAELLAACNATRSTRAQDEPKSRLIRASHPNRDRAQYVFVGPCGLDGCGIDSLLLVKDVAGLALCMSKMSRAASDAAPETLSVGSARLLMRIPLRDQLILRTGGRDTYSCPPPPSWTLPSYPPSVAVSVCHGPLSLLLRRRGVPFLHTVSCRERTDYDRGDSLARDAFVSPATSTYD